MHPIADPPPVGVLADATIHQNLPVKGERDRLLDAVHVHPTEADAQIVDVDDDAVWTFGAREMMDAVVISTDDDSPWRFV